MEKSSWIAVVVVIVMVGIFLVAYFTMSKPKTQSIAVSVPQSKVFVQSPLPFVPPQIPSPNYVVDTSYHDVQPAPQTGSSPITKEPFDKLPSTPVEVSKENDQIEDGKVNPAIAALLLQKQNV
jgi:hypothetical protein